MKFSIERFANTTLCPSAMRLLARAMAEAEVVDLNMHWSYPLVVAKDGDRVVGAVAYEITKHKSVLWIHSVYVKESHRMHGAWRKMFEELQAIAIEKDMLWIDGGISPGNLVSRQAAKAFGRYVLCETWRYDVPPKEDE